MNEKITATRNGIMITLILRRGLKGKRGQARYFLDKVSLKDITKFLGPVDTLRFILYGINTYLLVEQKRLSSTKFINWCNNGFKHKSKAEYKAELEEALKVGDLQKAKTAYEMIQEIKNRLKKKG